MPERSLWERMRPDWEFETWIRLGWILTGLFFLLAIVSLAGELLDWWNDLGETGTAVWTLGGLLVGIATLVLGAGREQATTIRRYVEENHALLRSSDRKLDTLDEIQLELDAQTGVLDEQLSVLRDVRERL